MSDPAHNMSLEERTNALLQWMDSMLGGSGATLRIMNSYDYTPEEEALGREGRLLEMGARSRERHLIGETEQYDYVSPDLAAKAAAWARENATPEPPGSTSSYIGLRLIASYMPENGTEPDRAAVREFLRALRRLMWSEGKLALLTADIPVCTPRAEVPKWLLDGYELTGKAPRKRAQPPIPAYNHTGIQGLGRITSDQITFALFDALTGPKDRWGVSGKGWPAYRVRCGDGSIAIVLRPGLMTRKHEKEHIAEMHRLKDDLNVSHFDALAMLIEQAMTYGRPDGAAYISANAMLDYRAIAHKRHADGSSAGHQQNLQNNMEDALYALAHLQITIEGLPLWESVAKGKAKRTTADLNERVLLIEGDLTRHEDGESLAWRYRFGKWFETFTSRPNRMVAYQPRKAIAYDPIKQQWSKQLAHYLLLELRRNADNGRALRRTVRQLFAGANISVDSSRPQRAKDRLEGALRQLIRDDLCRVEHNGRLLDAESSGLDTWTIAGADLPAQNWLDAYMSKSVVIHAPAAIERLYDREIRRIAPPHEEPPDCG